MTKLLDRLARLARGREGRRLAEKAKRLSDDPEHHRKIDEARERLAQTGAESSGAPAQDEARRDAPPRA
jgi:hypothetical protein